MSQHFPLRWDQIFHRSAPLGVEIGFGNGEFLVDWACHQPDWNLVGIELSIGSMERCLRRLAAAGVENVRLIRDHAGFVLRELFPDLSIRRVVMNFPDPWPKERHRQRRLIQPDFLQTLSAVLEMDGVFELVTDQEWYARETAEHFQRDRAFVVEPLKVNPRRPVTTKYERKWRSMGRDVYQVVARKNQHRTVERLLKEEAMPHEFLSIPITAQQVQKLAGRQFQEESQFFVVKECFQGMERDDYLFHLISRDGTYLQKYFLRLHRHGDQWLLKLDEITQPYRTPAVKRSVQQIARWLSASPGDDVREA